MTLIAVRSSVSFALLLGAVMLLPGCLSLGSAPDAKIYAPKIVITAPETTPIVTWSLLLARPMSSNAIDAERIVVRPQSGEVNVYEGAAWSDAAPDLLQAAMQQAFEDSGKITGVARQSSVMSGDFVLVSELRHFESIYTDRKQPPAIVVEMQLTLMSHTGNHVLAKHNVKITVPAASVEIVDVIDAFKNAMTDAITETVDWTLRTGQDHVPSPAAVH